MALHLNSDTESKFDTLYVFTCDGSNRCSLLYGCIESLLFAALLIGAYYLFFGLYFRMRYHFKSSDFLSGLDAYFIAMPWFLSPLLRWHSITSLLIDGLQLFDGLFFYQYPDDMDPVISSRNLLDELTSTTSSPAPVYELAAYPLLMTAFIRTLWSFLLWTAMDTFLWNNKSLLWLFENGPNSAILSLRSEHRRSVYNRLLHHFEGIDDVTTLCIDYKDDDVPLVLLDIKQDILESLRVTDLSTSYKVLSVVVVVVSAFRLWICPSVGHMLFPLFKVIGEVIFVLVVITFIVLLIMACLVADGRKRCECLIYCVCCMVGDVIKECLEKLFPSYKKANDFFVFDFGITIDHYRSLFVALCAAIGWGWIVWKCMRGRLDTLKRIQETSRNMTLFHPLETIGLVEP